MLIGADELIQQVAHFLLPFFRIAGFLMSVPVIGSRLIPIRARLVMAVVTAISISRLVPNPGVEEVLHFLSIPIIFEQIIIGVALGFAVQLFIQIGVVAGQIMAMQIGLGFSQLVDPANGVNVASISQLFLMMFTFLYLAMDGHLLTLEVLINSFHTLPIGGEASLLNSHWRIANLGSWLFASALRIALPAIFALYVVNLTFGIMSRAATQLQIFSIGFPFTMVYGLVIVWVVIGGVLPQYELFYQQLFERLDTIIRT